MKIAFVEENVIDGDGQYSRYFTEINDSYVSNSLSRDKEKAYGIYNTLLKSNGAKIEKTVIESVEI